MTMPPSPPAIRFGTSSWAYEGWQGLVYHRTYPKSRFSQDTLAEYAAYAPTGTPQFSTVGIDHAFYRPASAKQLAHYAEQVPETFRFCQKVWEDITIPAYANLPRYGAKAGKTNPRFLDIGAFRDLVLQSAVEGLGDTLGPFMFEFQRFGLDHATFLDRLDRFLAQLPPGLPYAVEVRNPAILGPRYRDTLKAHGVAHIYNHWTAMPPLSDQHRTMEQSFTAAFTVLRLLTPLGLVAAGRLPDLVDPSRRTTWYVSYLACTLLVLLGTPMLLSWIVKGTAAILETWSAPRLSPSLLITCRALLRNPAAVASPAAVIVLSAVIAFQGQFVTNTLGDRARQALAVSTALEGRVAVAMYFDGVRGAQEAIRRTPKGVHVLLVSESDPPEVMGTCEALADVGLTCPPSGQPQIAHLIGGDLQFLPLSIPIDQGTVEVLQGDPAAAAPRFTQQWLVFHSRTAINTEALQEAVVPTTWPNDGPDSPGYSYAGAGFAAAHESTWISLTALFALALLAIAIGCGTYSATLGLGKVLAPIGVLTARPGPFVVAAAALAALPTALGGVVAGLLGLRLTQIPVDAGIALPYGGTLLAGFVGVCIVAAAIQCLAAAFVVRTAAWSWRP